MKKQIKDLKLNDTVFLQSGYSIHEYRVVSISRYKLEISKAGNSKSFKMTSDDYTRHVFTEDSYHNHSVYLSRLDALKTLRKMLDGNLRLVFSKQQDFLKKVQEANESIRNCDAEIAEALKNLALKNL